MNSNPGPVTADQVEARPGPRCPECGEEMEYYGGTAGYICHDFKILVRGGGWFEGSGVHVEDRRLNNQESRGIRRH